MSQAMIVMGIQELNRGKQCFESWINDHKGSLGARLLKRQIDRLNSISLDLRSTNQFPQAVRDGIRNEFKEDAFSVPDLYEKICLLSPELREGIVNAIEKVLAGEKLTIEYL